MNYDTSADRAKKIRTALKREHGWTGRQISVRAENFSQGDAVRVSIKDAGIPMVVVEKIALEYRCSGSNEFVSVSYATGVLTSLFELLTDEIALSIETGSKVLGVFDVLISNRRLSVFHGSESVVSDVTAGCTNTAATAAYRLGRYVAATGVLSGEEVTA